METLVVEVQSGLLRQFKSLTTKRPETVKRAWSNLQQDRLARSKQAWQCGPNPSPHEIVKPVLRVHNYALEIPWAYGEGVTPNMRYYPKETRRSHQG